MNTRTIHTKVAGVTFEGRQLVLEVTRVGDPVMLRPEPSNKYDPHAIAVWVAHEDAAALQIGYVPKEIAAEIAPAIEGESLLGKVFEITGGFKKWDGSFASYGCIITVDIPDTEWHGRVENPEFLDG